GRMRGRRGAVEIGDGPAEPVSLASSVLLGGTETYPRCQREARRLRDGGAKRIVAPSAALARGGARGQLVHHGVRTAAARDGQVIVIYGPPLGLVGWVAAEEGRPADDLLGRVRHYRST